MADHYYTNTPSSPSDIRTLRFAYRGADLTFETDAGTFSRGRLDPGSALLLESAGDISGLCADVGCGWGAIGISLAAANPCARLVLTDVNERAAALARQNIARNQIENAHVLLCDALSQVEGPLDAVFTNPPIRAGKAVVFRIFSQAHERLRPGGTLSAVLRKQQGAPSAKAYLQELFGNCETIARGGGYHILRARKDNDA